MVPRRKGAGSGRREDAVAGTGRKRVKFHNISLYFGIDMRQRGEKGYGKGREAGVNGTGGGWFRPPCPPLIKFIIIMRSTSNNESVFGSDVTYHITLDKNKYDTKYKVIIYIIVYVKVLERSTAINTFMGYLFQVINHQLKDTDTFRWFGCLK